MKARVDLAFYIVGDIVKMPNLFAQNTKTGTDCRLFFAQLY